jgi:flagellar hook-basal body complex protein FliE
MSKSAFYNPKKAKEEKELKKVKSVENDKRKLFFERMKKDPDFQQYVVEEIIKANINTLTDTRLLKFETKNKEDLADLIIANIKASQTLTNIFNALL